MSTLLTGLEAWYEFDGHSTDYTLTGHNGVDTAVVYSPAKINQGAETIISSGGIKLTPSVSVGTVFTVNIWVKPKASPFNQGARAQWGAIFAQDNNNGMFLEQLPAGALRLQLWIGSMYSNTVIAEGVGFWLTMTADGANVRLYKDNVLLDTIAVAPSWSITYVLIGSSGNSCAAIVDSLAIWSRVLTVQERTELFNDGNGITYASLQVPVTPPNTVPTVANVTPTVGTTLGPTTPISLDVTDTEGFGRIRLTVKFANGDYDVVFDGTSFAPKYDQFSTVTPITDGFTFSVRPDTGWASGSSPQLFVDVTDASGAENA
jgi:hypothetical protein